MSEPIQPVRMTDDDVLMLMQHGPESAEGKAALGRLAQRLADWIDDDIAKRVYGDLLKDGVITPEQHDELNTDRTG